MFGVSFGVVTDSYRLWVMLGEWESFSCFGFVEHFHKIPDFTFTNNIHVPSKPCSVRFRISIYGPE